MKKDIFDDFLAGFSNNGENWTPEAIKKATVIKEFEVNGKKFYQTSEQWLVFESGNFVGYTAFIHDDEIAAMKNGNDAPVLAEMWESKTPTTEKEFWEERAAHMNKML